jgi:uncharacterized membrane protein
LIGKRHGTSDARGAAKMDKNRLEAFSDGVIAIIITIMVLDLKVPHNPTWQSYLDSYPVFISYALSYVFVGLYWSSHHHLFHKARKVNNTILWINMLGLFWLSLVPFVTASMGQSSFNRITVTLYAIVLTLCVISYLLLVYRLCSLHGADSEFSTTYRGLPKSYISIALNLSAATIAYFGWPKIAFLILALTALLWFVPNHRFELNHQKEEKQST